jgi:hypothetical protein
MKKFEKVNQSKIEKLLNDAPEKSLLKSVLGGMGPTCSKDVAYANTTYVNMPYYNRIKF